MTAAWQARLRRVKQRIAARAHWLREIERPTGAGWWSEPTRAYGLPMTATLRVQFVHGLESSPQGAKAQYLARHFQALTPTMDTSDFPACVELQARELLAFRPHVLVGSSFGGAVVLELLRRGDWRGPTLLLAQAGIKFGVCDRLPEGVPVLLVHGTSDTVVDPEDSRRLARTGTPDLVRLIELDDAHRLDSLVAGGEPTLEALVRSTLLPADQ